MWSGQRLLTQERYQSIAGDKARLVTKDTGTRHRSGMPAPAPHVGQRISGALKAAQHRVAVKVCGEAFRDFPLWLDIQRWTAEALAGLGAGDALRVVTQEVQGLVARFPALPRFLFDGDIPYANDETLSWLETLRSPSASFDGREPNGEPPVPAGSPRG